MKKLLKYIGILLGIILFIWFILFLFPLSSDSERAFFEGDEGTLLLIVEDWIMCILQEKNPDCRNFFHTFAAPFYLVFVLR